ncbi:MAG: YXWGXW repeat-containing protein [Acidobacteria bacterium]|nr:YXWGXW repeat-containing protein [Acidobacteriota bacterium]
MKTKWLLGGLLAAATFTAPAFGQISVYIGTPPPPIRYEVPPPMPEVGYVWMPGYWAPYGGRYVWAPGRWSRPPYYGAAWRGGGWDRDGRGWRYREGYWAPRGRDWHDRDWDDDGPGNRGRGHAYGHYKEHGRGHGRDHND